MILFDVPVVELLNSFLQKIVNFFIVLGEQYGKLLTITKRLSIDIRLVCIEFFESLEKGLKISQY